MHSSRMRTGRSLTICRSLPLGGGRGARVCFLGGRGAGSFFGGLLLGGLLLGGVGLLLLGVSFWGLPPSGGCLLPGDPPTPVDRITDTSKNITLATTSLRSVITENLWDDDHIRSGWLIYMGGGGG